MQEYIILELIPTTSNPKTGEIAQISALKLKGLDLVARFDVRLNPEKINNKEFEKMLSYDKQAFTYANQTIQIANSFKDWIGSANILVMQDVYTQKYLNHYQINNKTEQIFEKLDVKQSLDTVGGIIKKYNLQPSNHIVDLLYEALIYESNKDNKN